MSSIYPVKIFKSFKKLSKLGLILDWRFLHLPFWRYTWTCECFGPCRLIAGYLWWRDRYQRRISSASAFLRVCALIYVTFQSHSFDSIAWYGILISLASNSKWGLTSFGLHLLARYRYQSWTTWALPCAAPPTPRKKSCCGTLSQSVCSEFQQLV